eukprot:2375605-Rhodomonas_salina.4
MASFIAVASRLSRLLNPRSQTFEDPYERKIREMREGSATATPQAANPYGVWRFSFLPSLRIPLDFTLMCRGCLSSLASQFAATMELTCRGCRGCGLCGSRPCVSRPHLTLRWPDPPPHLPPPPPPTPSRSTCTFSFRHALALPVFGSVLSIPDTHTYRLTPTRNHTTHTESCWRARRKTPTSGEKSQRGGSAGPEPSQAPDATPPWAVRLYVPRSH